MRHPSKIPARPLSQEVAQRIRDMIRKGLVKKGDRIIEKEFCQSMGISRTPLREALRILSSEGLIDLVPNKGAYVAQPSLREIRELFEVMSILEGTCARVVAEKMTDGDLAKIEKLHAQLEKHFEEKEPEKYLKVNQRYHILLQELTGNRVLNEVVNGLRDKILLYRYRQLYQPDRFQASMNEHRALMEAFRKKDPATAESIMKRHLMNQCEALRALYAGVRREQEEARRREDTSDLKTINRKGERRWKEQSK
ncbi:MAG: GntR family transcriptional regulator [Thermodesulfobacteriota bacterium]